MKRPYFHPTRNDIDPKVRAEVSSILSVTLATSLDLKTQAKQAHWNVKGGSFLQLHELFDELSTELEVYVDTIAERIAALGGSPLGTARIAAANSVIPEYPFELIDGLDHVTALAERYASYGSHLRAAIEQTDTLGDADTADIYTNISKEVDKRLWFLESHITTT